MAAETGISLAKIEQNIAPTGTPAGFVIASPSKRDPDYFFHWTRDAALTMGVIVDTALAAPAGVAREHYLAEISAYVDFTRRTQGENTLSGTIENHHANVGEPKFNPDGTGFAGAWGRPQSDGPALRVITLLRFLDAAYDEAGHARLPDAALTGELYGKIRAAVAVDLEYLAYHGLDSTFDLWEETRGHHFYTELVQRRALLLGADDAEARSASRAADAYRAVAHQLEERLQKHWDGGRGYLAETVDRDGGIAYKTSNLDAAVVLAALHAEAPGDDYFAADDGRILATAARLKTTFRALYPVNNRQRDDSGALLGVAVGRYPEDRYDGSVNRGGNPWPLLTLAMAELDLRVAQRIDARGGLRVDAQNAPFFNGMLPAGQELRPGEVLKRTDARCDAVMQALAADADAQFARVRLHASSAGELAEQIDRQSGMMRSARDLTWSYASFLTAARLRLP